MDAGKLTLHAPAKINLFLRILAREATGFHQLETLFVKVAFGDQLTLERAGSGIHFESDGFPMGSAGENLVYRAASLFLERAGLSAGVRIHLDKRVPPASGLGGGSSDAAVTLRGLRQLFPGALQEAEVLALAGGLGSDVPFFLSPSPLTLAWGRGNRLLPLPPLPPASVLLALPPVNVPTADAYGLLARARGEDSTRTEGAILSLEDFSSWPRVGALARNDFEDVILSAFPLLGEIRREFQESGALFSLLSGSGSALFGLYQGEAEAARARQDLKDRFPEVDFLLTRTEGVAEKRG